MATADCGQTLQVGLGERSYPIHIRPGLLAQVGSLLRQGGYAKRYAVIADDQVAEQYGAALLRFLHAAWVEAELITFPAGESSKHLATVAGLASRLARARFDRHDGLIALGGGVTGDITGFLAGIYMRGIPFVQVPTTLLAQVDSSVGGKTGVDLPEGKNLIGVFLQPRAVFIDPEVLASLPRDEFLGGLAEVIKYGVIRDSDFFTLLERERERILAQEPDALIEVIARCCAIKAAVVEEDEREGGVRRILNFGHTIGHALEAASNFAISHGFCVAMGMVAAARLSVRVRLLAAAEADRLQELLVAYGLPVAIPPSLAKTWHQWRTLLLADKKTVGGRVFFVLPRRIGEVVVTDEVAEDDVRQVCVGRDL
ncbi:MAG: 3-dehydroquinate synthase [Desulfobulbaceae bacterium A2]|nr:MAG: 3-dehydroquinate synthase [Desulfobulbaceae bacterium A2]